MRKTIALDAGHGLYTAGKRCLKALDPKETREWQLNSRIAGYAQAGFAAYGCRALRVDDPTGVEDVPLATRAARANNAKADIFISIHHNAGISGGTGGGICVYVSKAAGDAALRLAHAVYEDAVDKTGLKGNRSKGVWADNFAVLTRTSMPAVLGEFGFMDSSTDVPAILSDKFARECADGIVSATARVLRLEPVGDFGDDEGANPQGCDEPSAWAREACEWAANASLFVGHGSGSGVAGSGGVFDWQGTMTREAFAVILKRYFDYLAGKVTAKAG